MAIPFQTEWNDLIPIQPDWNELSVPTRLGFPIRPDWSATLLIILRNMHTGPYWTLRDHGDHTGLYGTIENRKGPYGTIKDHSGPYFPKCHFLCLFVCLFLNV